MLKTEYILLILGMGLVTYIPRWFPLFFLTQRKIPQWFVEWLDLIPAAILSALIFSDLFVTGDPHRLAILQLKSMVAIQIFLFALRTKSLGGRLLWGWSCSAGGEVLRRRNIEDNLDLRHISQSTPSFEPYFSARNAYITTRVSSLGEISIGIQIQSNGHTSIVHLFSCLLRTVPGLCPGRWRRLWKNMVEQLQYPEPKAGRGQWQWQRSLELGRRSQGKNCC